MGNAMIGYLRSGALLIVGVAVTPCAVAASVETYTGLCEASAAARLDASHFAVASDETNRLQLYERGQAQPIGEGVNLEPFTGFDKSDLEGASVAGDRIYWISSHSFNSKGEDKKKRKVLFATRIDRSSAAPTLRGDGAPYVGLRDALAVATGLDPGKINIEGLAATPDGALLVGLRSPLQQGRALVIELRNPANLVDGSAEPEFGELIPLPLEGRGVRSIERVGEGDTLYLIVGGPVTDADEGYALYRWAGPGADPVRIDVDFAGIRPEALVPIDGARSVQVLSDDGNECSDEETATKDRRFRSIEIPY